MDNNVHDAMNRTRNIATLLGVGLLIVGFAIYLLA